MKSLYAQFVEERAETRFVLEHENCFATLELVENDQGLYIVDFFVEKESREKGIAFKLMEEVAQIAKDKGCKFLLGSCDPRSRCADRSIKAILRSGMKPLKTVGELVYFIKEL